MKKILLAFTMLLAMVACTNKPATAVEDNKVNNEVAVIFPLTGGKILMNSICNPSGLFALR